VLERTTLASAAGLEPANLDRDLSIAE